MIERIFNIDGAEVEVTFMWDSGDMSVGIGAGWGEDTGVLIKAGPLHTAIIFEVDDGVTPASWKISEVQVLDKTERRWGALCIDVPKLVGDTKVYQTLSELPVIADAVAQTWQQVLDIQALESVGEDGWSLESHISELEYSLHPEYGYLPDDIENRTKAQAELWLAQAALEEVKAKSERMKAEYAEKYKNADIK